MRNGWGGSLLTHTNCLSLSSGPGEILVGLEVTASDSSFSGIQTPAGRISAGAPILMVCWTRWSGQHCHRALERFLSPPTTPRQNLRSTVLLLNAQGPVHNHAPACAVAGRSHHNRLPGSISPDLRSRKRCLTTTSEAGPVRQTRRDSSYSMLNNMLLLSQMRLGQG